MNPNSYADFSASQAMEEQGKIMFFGSFAPIARCTKGIDPP